jgi:hypothetical protein
MQDFFVPHEIDKALPHALFVINYEYGFTGHVISICSKNQSRATFKKQEIPGAAQLYRAKFRRSGRANAKPDIFCFIHSLSNDQKQYPDQHPNRCDRCPA